MIRFYSHSGIFTLFAEQEIPVDIDAAWEFFSSPKNLATISPPEMKFIITSPLLENDMYPGQLITYIVKPFKWLKSNWVTEITQVKEKEFFIDEQRSGPYAMWHHEHKFVKTTNGVLMTDIVSYKVPGGLLGKILNSLIIKRKLKRIFQFREKAVLNELL